MTAFPRRPLAALVSLAARTGAAQAKDTPAQGDLVLPGQATVFGPCAREDGVPAPELLHRLPETLVLGGKQATGRSASFDTQRCLDCAPFTGTPVGSTAWVYLAFAPATTGPASFGFGADWWYEAYLDGTLISETLSRGDQGNEAWPPSIHDVTVTVEVPKGPHVLAVRLLRGSGSALLAMGGPLDLRNPVIRNAPKPAGATAASATVAQASFREGPPPERKWKLIWYDEFDGTALDTVKWNVQPQDRWNWPDIRTEPSPANLFLDGNGALVLQLTRNPDGTVRHPGSINGRFAKAYGYIETRAHLQRPQDGHGAVRRLAHRRLPVDAAGAHLLRGRPGDAAADVPRRPGHERPPEGVDQRLPEGAEDQGGEAVLRPSGGGATP
jgi:hypothetical protein